MVFRSRPHYAPLPPREVMERMPMMQGRGRGMPMMEHMLEMQQGYQQWREAIERVQAEKYVILVELDPEPFNTAVKRQLLQIIILSVVLLLVGIGGWLSLLTLQGYKGSQTRLRRMRAFNDLLGFLLAGRAYCNGQCRQYPEHQPCRRRDFRNSVKVWFSASLRHRYYRPNLWRS